MSYLIDTTATKVVIYPEDQLCKHCSTDNFEFNERQKPICKNKDCVQFEKETELIPKPEAVKWTIGAMPSTMFGRINSESLKAMNFLKSDGTVSPDQVTDLWVKAGLKNAEGMKMHKGIEDIPVQFETVSEKILSFPEQTVVAPSLLGKIPFTVKIWLALEIQKFSKDAEKN